MAYVVLIAGLIVLVFAGDLLVRGSVSIAERLGIPTLIIGLTIVALGTSAPELVISLDAALSGAPGIALGNVIGSNVANILLVLGLPSLFAATRCDQPALTRNTLFMLGATAVFIALAYTEPLYIWQGLVLVTLMAGFLWYSATHAIGAISEKNGDAEPGDTAETEDDGQSLFVPIVFVIAGLIGLPFGAHLTVEGARDIALASGMSEAAVGLTLVAVGTSLPELAATTMAAVRRESAIAVGNVIGSNIFNLLAILGITAIAAPIPISPDILTIDIWVMATTALAIVPFVIWKIPIGRLVGLIFIVAYAVYVITIVGHRTM